MIDKILEKIYTSNLLSSEELHILTEWVREPKDRIDKAIEYIKSYDVFKEFTFPLMKRNEENQVKSSIDYQFKKDLKKNLLEILGDKEND